MMMLTSPRLAVLLVGVSLCARAQQPAQSGSARDHVARAAQSFVLTNEGLKPWHLHARITVYDEAGKNPVQGSWEEWWIAPGKLRSVVTAGTYSETEPAIGARPQGRIRFLVEELERAALDPLENVLDKKDKFTEHSQDLGKARLSCIEASETKAHFPAEEVYCFDFGTDLLRLMRKSSAYTTVFNSVGNFQGRRLATNLTLGVQDRLMISAQIDKLETFNPATLTEPVTTSPIPEPKAAKDSESGSLITKTPPVYPVDMLRDHLSGTVLLGAVVGKDGSIAELFVLSSPHPAFSRAALDAVHQWHYKPLLQDGQPTEVETIIVVNFNLN